MARGKRIGITALVPPELIYACGASPFDLNNVVPSSNLAPKNKLCAWTATWREMLLTETIDVQKLVVVAGGDCLNAVVDGEKIAKKIPTHFFCYPFNGEADFLRRELDALADFLGGIENRRVMAKIADVKQKGLQLDRKRADGTRRASELFSAFISFSDMGGDIKDFEKKIDTLLAKPREKNEGIRVALLGVPPIYQDFHSVLEKTGFHVVFDELPYEFLRLGGTTMSALAKTYTTYTFARNIEYRIALLQKELERRRADVLIHYTQFACHHVLEDDLLRDALDYPMLTIQGDLPRKTPENVKLRIEAFYEFMQKR